MPRARIQRRRRDDARSGAARRCAAYQRRTDAGRRSDSRASTSAGTNTRRIKGALAPLLRGGPLSKDAVSRLVGRLREDFETWRTRDLADEDIRYVFMDGWYPKVRHRRPARAGARAGDAWASAATAQRVVLDLRLVGEESAASWREVVASLVARHLGAARCWR